ncbi:MAG: CPBP family intramembrane metalloprotease [Acetobacteraceae bacterium]|nr:CPBP family intramembrane metalloprotease [Acetobacteraceae bacterium]
MTQSAADGLPTQAATPTRRPEQPWKLIAWALVWLLAAVLGSLVGGMLTGLAMTFSGAGGGRAPIDDRSFLMGSTASLQLVLLWASWRRARIVGGGSRCAGLGWIAVRRRWLVVVLAVALVLNVVGLLVLLRYVGAELRGSTGVLLHRFTEMNASTQAALVFLLVCGAPVTEELFFRGWLWTSLRRYWGPVPVMVCTSLLWLCAHLLDGPARPIFLIPGAIALSLARHYCGSVRASIVLHVFNNLLAVSLFALAMQAQ